MKHFLRKLDAEEQRLFIITLLLAIFISVGAFDIVLDGVISLSGV